MLRFAAQGLKTQSERDGGVSNLYIECFLLHYRNLIRFLSGKHHRQDDISMAEPSLWAEGETNPEDALLVRNMAKELDEWYFAPISKYLQHCTVLRADETRSWDVTDMHDRLEAILVTFEQCFPADSRADQ